MNFKRVFAIIAAALLVSTAGFALSGCGDPSDLYVQAHYDLRNGLYSEAGAKFISLGDYISAPEKVVETYNINHNYYGVDSYDMGELSNGSKINLDGGKNSKYRVTCRVDDSFSSGTDQKILRMNLNSPYYTNTSGSSDDVKNIHYDIMQDGTLMVMGGYRKYFDLVISPGKPEKEKIYFILHEDYIIEKDTFFNGKINQSDLEEQTFNAELNRNYEKYIFNKNGTFSYSGYDYAEQKITEVYTPPKTDFNGIYHREGDFIILEYNGKTRGLLIYNDTIVDRCMLSGEFVL